MSKRTIWIVRVRHILQAIEEIQDFIREIKDEEDFYKNTLVIRGVERCFQIIGEAAKHVPEDIVQAYPDVPWREMRTMRNFVVHDYSFVEKDILWDTIIKELPVLKPEIQKIIEENSNDNQ